jgi:hypothetical protein
VPWLAQTPDCTTGLLCSPPSLLTLCKKSGPACVTRERETMYGHY